MKKIKQLINNIKYLCVIDLEKKLNPVYPQITPTVSLKDIKEALNKVQKKHELNKL